MKAHNLRRECKKEFSSLEAKNSWEFICKTGKHPTNGELVGVPVPVQAEARRFYALLESQAVFLEEDPENG